jgi:hypothetical protein
MHKRKLRLLSACLFALSLALACKEMDNLVSPGDDDSTGGSITAGGDSGTFIHTVANALSLNETIHESSQDYSWDVAKIIPITLNGSSIAVNGTGVTVDGSRATIYAAGTYSLSGELDDGQIIVQATSADMVRLILNGVKITSSTNAPIDIEKAQKAIIVLAEGTTNTLTDAASYVFPDADTDEPNAALYSKVDLTIYGQGSLNVNGNFNDAIASKDGLIIASGKLNVTAVDDGIRGKDYLVVKGGTITVEAKGDGLKSDNDEEANRGYVWVENGILTISAGDDAITGETDALISDGTIAIVSGGGSNYKASSTVSAKGIKGTVYTIIDGGTISINSADDGVHSNRFLVFNGGTITISSGDDGIHADSTLGINGGDIRIAKSYEGIESKMVAINAGTIHLTTSDDGINGAGGKDASGAGGWQNPTFSGTYYLYLNGGSVAVQAAGDGIDVNGTIVMTGGTVLVHGPISNGNGALDYDKVFKMTGGILVAAGSSGMAQAPSSSSTQNALLINFTTAQSAGSLFNLQTTSGESILTFAPLKAYQSVAFSSPKLVKGSYYAYTGGSSTGTPTDGLYDSGTYTPGTKYASFNVTSALTTLGGRSGF